MQLGKTFLGDEGMEKVKKGDLSEIMNLGKQFLGEETMNDIITGVADQFIQMKDLKIKTSDKKENTDEKVMNIQVLFYYWETHFSIIKNIQILKLFTFFNFRLSMIKLKMNCSYQNCNLILQQKVLFSKLY